MKKLLLLSCFIVFTSQASEKKGPCGQRLVIGTESRLSKPEKDEELAWLEKMGKILDLILEGELARERYLIEIEERLNKFS